MPEAIHDAGGVCALAQRLAAAISADELSQRPPAGGWIRAAGDSDALAGEQHAMRSATRFLVEAVDWNAGLLYDVCHADAVTGDAADIVSSAWVRAFNAQSDPLARRRYDNGDEDESPAESLAYFALTGGRADPADWRECDRDAAVEVLPFVAARMRTNADEYLFPLGDVDDALRWLILMEPTLPDRRDTTGKAAD